MLQVQVWVVAVALLPLPGASERNWSANKKCSRLLTDGAVTFSDRMHASFAPPVALKVGGGGGGGVGFWRLAEIDGAWTDGGTGKPLKKCAPTSR